MTRTGDWMHRLAEGMAGPEQPLPGRPLVEIAGDCRVLIENHRGVTRYGRELISVRVQYGQVEVCGCGLELARMTKDQLVISGRIQCVKLNRRGK